MKNLRISLTTIFLAAFGGALPSPADDLQKSSNYTAAEIWTQHSNAEPADKLHVNNPEKVAELAAHFPGILGKKGTGPRTGSGHKGKITILFYHEDGAPAHMRVAHLSADMATWRWRDNTPFTGDRPVQDRDALLKLLDELKAAAKSESPRHRSTF